ncbi:MAG TPA: DUF1080 domain-containing protein [Opitutaceae bacterium]|nr:DUF1080 domain-containing protein [Opitutaceae bacterium]
MRPLLVFLSLPFFSAAALLHADAPSVHAVLLPSSLAGWKYVTPANEGIESVCRVKPDGVIAVTGKPNGYIATELGYENYNLHVEWRWTDKGGNGGVLVHITDGPMDRIWPISFQIQTKNTRAGDLLPMSSAKFFEPPSPELKPAQRARLAEDSEKPVGEWNTCDVICRGDTIEAAVNGVAQNRVTQCIPSSGKIGFQLEGAPFELRNVWIEPLKPAGVRKE